MCTVSQINELIQAAYDKVNLDEEFAFATPEERRQARALHQTLDELAPALRQMPDLLALARKAANGNLAGEDLMKEAERILAETQREGAPLATAS